jgi:hypothetical protein
MDCNELLKRAKHYRELARGATDHETMQSLMYLAEKYEALAAGDEGLGDHSDPSDGDVQAV